MDSRAQMSTESVEGGISGSEGLDGMVLLIARLMMAQLFVIAGIRKILNWEPTVKNIGMHLPMPDVLIYAVVALEVGGGLLFALGWRTRQLAALLGAFTLVAGLLFHQFWAAPDAQFVAQLNNFLKNVAITGGFLLFVLVGGGRLGLDRR